MTPEDFRRLALSLPEAVELAHLGTPDFRVRGKIFASVSESKSVATLKLQRGQQEMVCAAEPELFRPVAGYWGESGWTELRLERADVATVRSALAMAWRNVAPKRLTAALDTAAS
jgi:hypothetical protein